MTTSQFQRCAGMSLVSTMVGLLLGTIVVVTMATLYKVMLTQSVQTKISSKQDSESVMALTTVPSLLMRAGYGIRDLNGPAGASNVDLLVVSNATLSARTSGTLSGSLVNIQAPVVGIAAAESSFTGNALIWSWSVNNTGNVAQTYCSGLLSTNGALLRLQPTLCANAVSQWSSINWTTQTMVADRVNPSAASTDPFGFSFVVNQRNSTCQPFGVPLSGLGAGGLSVTVRDDTKSATKSSQNNGVRSVTFESTVCLPNIAK